MKTHFLGEHQEEKYYVHKERWGIEENKSRKGWQGRQCSISFYMRYPCLGLMVYFFKKIMDTYCWCVYIDCTC